jgi:hypothetical protein
MNFLFNEVLNILYLRYLCRDDPTDTLNLLPSLSLYLLIGSDPSPRDSHTAMSLVKTIWDTNGMNPLKDLHILDTCELSISYLSFIYTFKKF